ncbi:DUF4397 domain-containing protein [Vibrio quintilis]|uniref:DUF4397 domain-containing protein n=1 Tax=Vibrio quintilis TaxID=1117707 RepID=A0A1M7Z2B9_9VIBR|nr:DUF4397 domain-containing protein [Vibrio quintilis]SHO59109.1 hypothetical protein VQ7734_04886 [Vibrio quintilis]
MKVNSLIAVFGSAIFLAGCNHEDDNDVQLRVTHASSDAPMVSVTLNGDVASGLEKTDYQVAGDWIGLMSGSYDIAVNALLPGDQQSEVIGANLNFSPDMQYDVIAVNNAASIEPVVLSRDAAGPEGNFVRLDILHAHPDVAGVDIYLSTEEDISSVDPAVSGLEFKIDSADLPVTIPSGTYRIRVTLAGDKSAVFDSGNLELTMGSDLMITALPNVDGGAVSPVNLLVADKDGYSVLRSTGEKAAVRVVHAVDDAPDVDVLASGSAVDGLTMISFKEFRSKDLDPGSYDLSVAASSDNSLVVIEAPGTALNAGSTTSIYAVGKLNSVTDETIDPLVIAEDLRSVASYAKLRVVHASPTAGGLGLVDIHASATGTFDATTVVLSGVDFKGTATLNVPEGTYYLAVILAGDMTYTPAVQATAAVEDGGVYSVVATDDFAGGLLLNVDTAAP